MKILKWLDEYFEESLLVILLVLISVVMLAQVFARYVLNNSMSWPEEFCRYCYVWSVFLSLSFTIKKRSMLRVGVVMDLFPAKIQSTMRIFCDLVMLALFVVFFQHSFAVVGNIKNVIPDDRKFIMVVGDGIGKEYKFSGEKLTTLLALYRYERDFGNALAMMDEIYKVGGRGHSCGIYSHNDAHIEALALRAPVTRIMVRQPQSKANAGSAENGMPMTSSMGCGVWGGNQVSDNIDLKYYMQFTHVASPILKDQPDEATLFGKFYDPEVKRS